MNIINYCPCCNEKDLLSRRSIIAPFISDYVLNETETLSCKLLSCTKCGFVFFDKRFTDAQVNKLYGKYRKQLYLKTRNKHEFFYTRKVNNSFDANIESRRKEISDFFKNLKLDSYPFKNILDYGGDKGQFLPSCFDSSNKWLYDLSDNKPVKNVIKLLKFTADKENFFDLIQACNLLEHIPYPDKFLSYTRNFIRTNGYIYIEVPSEQFKYRSIDSKIFDAYILFITKYRLVFNFVDILSLFFRLRFRVLPFWGIMKLHEHISFFNVNSLAYLLENNGFKVIRMEERNINRQKVWRYGKSKVIQCLAMKN